MSSQVNLTIYLLCRLLTEGLLLEQPSQLHAGETPVGEMFLAERLLGERPDILHLMCATSCAKMSILMLKGVMFSRVPSLYLIQGTLNIILL